MTVPSPPGPAVALLDLGDIPAALAALDALAKEAHVEILARGTVQPGRYLLFFAGSVEAVQRSAAKALEAGGDAVVDDVLLPYADARIVPAVLDGATRPTGPGDTLGVLHNRTAPTLIRCVDAALKGAEVGLVQLRIADGLGGAAIAMVWGEGYDVEAAVEIATEAAQDGRPDGFSTRIVRNADPEVTRALSGRTTFFQEWRG